VTPLASSNGVSVVNLPFLPLHDPGSRIRNRIFC
jgi:hypothetical protein